jgi:aspartate/methionine/tyrosine aminotransferase
VPIFVSLNPEKGWTLDFDELRSKITSKTKAIIVNNPNNPLGKVWTMDELMKIRDVAVENDLLVLADEVYETLVFNDSQEKMIKMGRLQTYVASLPDMFERTITVGSMGKMLGITGWKIGWLIASAEIVRSCWLVHQFMPFCVTTPLQEAGAEALEIAMENNYFAKTATEYQALRDYLMQSLKEVGFKVIKPDGGYFVVADISEFMNEKDFSTYLTENAKVTSIPMGSFYHKSDQGKVKQYVRFAFCKDLDTLKAASQRLKNYFSS